MKNPLTLMLLLISLVVANATPEEKVARMSLVVTSETDFVLGLMGFNSVDALKAELEALVRIQPRPALLIVYKDKTPFPLQVSVLDACRRAGVSDIKIEGAPAGKKEPNRSSAPTAPSGHGSP